MAVLSALRSLVIYLVRNGSESLDESYLLKFKLINSVYGLGEDSTEVFISIHVI